MQYTILHSELFRLYESKFCDKVGFGRNEEKKME